MTKMTPGERVVRCFIGEEIDRVPFGVGIGWLPWEETRARWRQESGMAELDVDAYFGFDPSFVHPAYSPGIFPPYKEEVLEENAEFIIHRDSRGITKRDRRDGGSMPQFLDYPVKTPEDWERLKNERLSIDAPGRITQDWDEFRARLKDKGEAVQVGGFPYGIFGTPRDFMGDEELLIAFYEEPEMVKDMMEHLASLWLSIFEKVAAEVQIDHIHIWEDMSGCQGSLLSPRMVEEFMMPCYDRITDFARSAGVRVVSVDTDGDCGELVPIMMRHGINMFFPFEVQAGNDILAYRRQYPELGIEGGLDKRALAVGKAEIDKEIAIAAEMIKYGRYVPGFDHLIPPDVSWENFHYAVTQMRKLCLG